MTDGQRKTDPKAGIPDVPILPLGVDGLLVRFSSVLDEPANRAALAYRQAVAIMGRAGINEVAASLGSVLVRFDPAVTDRAACAAMLTRLLAERDWFRAELPQPRRLWTIPVAFGGEFGPQLADAAALAGLTPEAAIRNITETTVRVLAVGFAPGQPYLGMLGDQWNIPRQTSLTPTVPEGALVVAIRQLVLFSATSPTGWRQIGETAFRAFRPDATEPFPLRAGDEVRFAPVSHDAYRDITEANADGSGGAVLKVLS